MKFIKQSRYEVFNLQTASENNSAFQAFFLFSHMLTETFAVKVFTLSSQARMYAVLFQSSSYVCSAHTRA